jgi:hypothetical protein
LKWQMQEFRAGTLKWTRRTNSRSLPVHLKINCLVLLSGFFNAKFVPHSTSIFVTKVYSFLSSLTIFVSKLQPNNLGNCSVWERPTLKVLRVVGNALYLWDSANYFGGLFSKSSCTCNMCQKGNCRHKVPV